MEASKLGAGVGADWDSVHESFLFFAQSDIVSDSSEVILITTLGLWQKDKWKMCTVCVCTCRAHKADGFYDFAVKDKWQRVKVAMRRMSIRELAILKSSSINRWVDQCVWPKCFCHICDTLSCATDTMGEYKTEARSTCTQAKHGQVCGKKVWVSAEGPGVGWISWPAPVPFLRDGWRVLFTTAPPPSALVRVILACPPKTGDPNSRPPATPIDLCGCSRLGET